jgi:hypothetical protein
LFLPLSADAAAVVVAMMSPHSEGRRTTLRHPAGVVTDPGVYADVPRGTSVHSPCFVFVCV